MRHHSRESCLIVCVDGAHWPVIPERPLFRALGRPVSSPPVSIAANRIMVAARGFLRLSPVGSGAV